MSTLDRQPRFSGARNDALHEHRVDPGTERLTRANQPQKLAPVPPRGLSMTGAPKRMPVKR